MEDATLMPIVRFEVETADGRRILNVRLSDELWAKIEDLSRTLTELGTPKTPEEIASEALGIGLSMTHGMG